MLRAMSLSMYACETTEVAAALSVDPQRGLAAGEAGRREVHFGRNVIHGSRLRRAFDLLALLATAAGAVLAMRRQGGPAISVAVAVAMYAAVMHRLRPCRPPMARVLCNGEERVINGVDLVPGDVIVVDSGAEVPADARLVTAAELAVDESKLTGESFPVAKSSAAVPADAPLAKRRSMLYLGTHVVSGHATAIVTATGDATELGKLCRAA